MKKFKIKSFGKINLSLKVLKKLKDGYHNISSIITFCEIHDVISIKEIKATKDNISFSGRFKKNINLKFNTITKLLYQLRKKNLLKEKVFKINIKKNIPHGSGLGGGSSNAASLMNFFRSNSYLNIKKQKMIKIAYKIGSDVPIALEKKNTILTGKRRQILRINNRFNLHILIVYPNIICSTRHIFLKNKKFSKSKTLLKYATQKKKILINSLINENNDLEDAAIKLYPKIGNLIKLIRIQKGCYFSRITGSGSACIGIFSNISKAINAQKLIKLKFPKYWSVLSKTM